MGNYANLNVLSNKSRLPKEVSGDAIDQVASMINNSGKNRAQRRRLEKSLGRMQTVLEHSQKYLDRSALKQYEAAVEDNYRHFFAILGIVLKREYGWEQTDDNEQIADIFDKLNEYLVKYKDLTVDEICDICDEETDITLIAQKS